MAETDDPQDKPENTPGKGSNRSRRRPWQNRSARSQDRPARPETQPTPPAQPPEQGPAAWKPLPPATGRGSAQVEQNQARKPGADRPRREDSGQNRPDQPGRSRGRPHRQAGDASTTQNPARRGRPPRSTDGTAAGQDGARQQNQNRPPRRPDNTPAGQDGNRAQNQNRARRGGNARQQNGQNPQGAAAPGGQPGRQQRRRPDGSQPRSATGRGPRQQRAPFTGRTTDGNFHAPSVPIKARGGIRARTENGEFGKNWWAKRWLLAMERLMDGARLQRGRRYARMGQVLSMNEENGGIIAKVQGSRPQPYKVTIRVSPLSDEQWDKVLDVLADQAIFTAQLLAGEMPADIEEAFSAADVSLFPARGGDLMTECSCPDWANPCKHIAATHYILGDRFDEDPFLIFRMRGRDQEAILQGLRQRRAGQEEPAPEEPEPVEVVEPLDADLAHFWEIGPALETYSVNVQPPQVELPLLKRLGQPDFARNLPLERELGSAYDAISQAALLLAFSDISREPPENSGESA